MKTKPRLPSTRMVQVAAMIIAALFIFSACSSPPTKTFHMVNTGDESRSLTLQLVKADGGIEEAYTIDQTLAPGEQAFEQVPSGKYFASVWNDGGKLVQELETVNALLPGSESNFNPIVIDLALDKRFVLANINYLYEGAAIADMISGAVGADQTTLKLVNLFDGAQAFEVEAKYRGGVHFVDIFTPKVQETVGAGVIVYALVPIPAGITDKKKVLNAVHQAVLSKL